MPTISTFVAHFLMMPRSMRPVATVPRPVDGEDVFDGHEEGLVEVGRWASGMYSSTGA
jgi:hypothetical protein